MLKEKATIHDFIDYSFAREVVRDHPKIIRIYEKLLPALYHYAQYQCTWPVIQMVEDSLLLAQMQHDHYKKIFDTKGLVKSYESTRKKEKP